MPAPVDPIQVDQRKPALPDDLEVVALDRVPPPALGDAPCVADLDVLPPAVPADRDEVAGRVELGLDRRVLTEQAGHRRLTQRPTPSLTQPLPAATSSELRGAAPRDRRARPA